MLGNDRFAAFDVDVVMSTADWAPFSAKPDFNCDFTSEELLCAVP